MSKILQPAFSQGKGSFLSPGLIAQTLVISAVAVIIVLLGMSLVSNLEERSIRTGFGFLWQAADFKIGQSLIPFSPQDNFATALFVGLLNTLIIAALAIILATILGVAIGVAALSRNPSVSVLARLYVEWIRNVPLLVQLYLWYAVFTQMMPRANKALNPLPGFYLDSAGLHFPTIQNMHFTGLLSLGAGIVASIAYGSMQRKRGEDARFGMHLALAFSPVLCVMFWQAATTNISMPVASKFGFKGGGVLPSEFLTLLVGLTLYNAAFIGEIVRAGIVSVSKGQSEAGFALGLSYGDIMRKIVLPQAMIVAIPPLSSQYLNLTKNTSLAIAIGYPDLMSIANTIINQTGQAVEIIALTMGTYLILSLLIATFMNRRNARLLKRISK